MPDHHEIRRIRTLTTKQLRTRIKRCNPDKLIRFRDALIHTKNFRLADMASQRLLELNFNGRS